MRHAKKLLKLISKVDDAVQELHDKLRDFAYEEEEKSSINPVKPVKKKKLGRPKKKY